MHSVISELTKSKDIEKNGFSINGLDLGNIALIIQPSRGYDSDNINDINQRYSFPNKWGSEW